MEYHTTQQLADAMGISRRAVLKRIKHGTIPAMRVGHAWLITDEAYCIAVAAGRLPVGRKARQKA